MALMDLSTVPELVLAEEAEYDLRCIKAQTTTSKNTGRNGIMLVHEFVGEDNYVNLIETLWFGNNAADGDLSAYDKDDVDKSNLIWRMFQDRLKAFDMTSDGELEVDDLLADFQFLEFSAYVVIEDSDDFPSKNVIKKIT